MLFGVGVELGMAVLTLQPCAFHMMFVAKNRAPSLIFQRDISTIDTVKGNAS